MYFSLQHHLIEQNLWCQEDLCVNHDFAVNCALSWAVTSFLQIDFMALWWEFNEAVLANVLESCLDSKASILYPVLYDDMQTIEAMESPVVEVLGTLLHLTSS